MASKYYTRDNLYQYYLIAERGDILEFPRGFYSHFGVYVGEYKGIKHCVIHLTVSDDADKYFLFKTSASLKKLDESYKQELLKVGFLIEKMKGESPGELRCDSLEDVMEIGGKFFVNNTENEKWKPRKDTAEVAVRRYENRFQEPSYNLRRNNCEHFVNDTRYDRHESKQVENAEAAATATAVIAGGAALLGASYYLFKSFTGTTEKEQRRY